MVRQTRKMITDTHGYSQLLTDTHGYSRILTDTHGYSQILTDTHGYSQILTDTHGTAFAIGPKGKARTHCYVCDANFVLRVKLRRHIRSGPLKPAPATCFYIFGISCKTMRLSRLEVGGENLLTRQVSSSRLGVENIL